MSKIKNFLFDEAEKALDVCLDKLKTEPVSDVLTYAKSLHVDYNFSHKGALYYLNTCDGHTKIEGENVETIANRMVFFDAGEEHNSTNCTNDKFRVNINFNYF